MVSQTFACDSESVLSQWSTGAESVRPERRRFAVYTVEESFELDSPTWPSQQFVVTGTQGVEEVVRVEDGKLVANLSVMAPDHLYQITYKGR